MSVQTPEEQIASNLRIVKNFCGTIGERIEEMSLVNKDGSLMTDEQRIENGIEEPLAKYVGVVSIINQIPSPMGMMGIPSDARFTIMGATTPTEALENYEGGVHMLDAEMRRQQKEAMEEMQKQQLIVPDAMESQAINSSGLYLAD